MTRHEKRISFCDKRTRSCAKDTCRRMFLTLLWSAKSLTISPKKCKRLQDPRPLCTCIRMRTFSLLGYQSAVCRRTSHLLSHPISAFLMLDCRLASMQVYYKPVTPVRTRNNGTQFLPTPPTTDAPSRALSRGGSFFRSAPVMEREGNIGPSSSPTPMGRQSSVRGPKAFTANPISAIRQQLDVLEAEVSLVFSESQAGLFLGNWILARGPSRSRTGSQQTIQ